MKNIIRQAAACIVCLSVISPVFATNGYFAHGYGTKNKGLVGAGVALPEDAMIAATNPAGMVFVGERMDIGAAIFSPSPRSYEVTGAPSDFCAGPAGPCTFSIVPDKNTSEGDYFLVPSFAYNWMLDSDSSAGLTVYGNGGMNTKYKGGTARFFFPAAWGGPNAFVNSPGTFGGGTTGVDLKQLFINGSYARKFAPNASFGVSVIYAYQQFKATGLSMFAPFSSDPAHLSDNGVDSSSGFGLKVGVQAEVSPGVNVGASYQPQMKMGKFKDYKGLFAKGGQFDIPATATIGVAWNVMPTGTLVLDYQKIYYSKVDSIANSVDEFANCMPGFPTTGGSGAGCLGGDSGAGFGWEDMSIIKIGYQWSMPSMPGWLWRAGYSKGDQPIPSKEVMFNIVAPAVIEQHVTFGFTKDIDPQSEFNFALMYALSNSVKGDNPMDTNQQIKLEMSQIELEASYSKKF